MRRFSVNAAGPVHEFTAVGVVTPTGAKLAKVPQPPSVFTTAPAIGLPETSLGTVVPGATHLFEEPGTLAVAAEAARDWFLGHLAPDARTVARP